ncbi:flagellin [Desulfopila aestuarii]
MKLSTADGRNIDIKEVLGGATDGAADTVVGYFGNTLTGAAATNHDIYKADITLSGAESITVAVAAGSANLFAGGTGGTGPANGANQTTNVQGIDNSDILTASNSGLAIKRVDQAISDIDSFRGTLGAMQNRFESTISNLNNVSENLSAARSRILDADIAQETSAMTKNNILQQAGVSILAQANQAPQLALSLLG